MDVYVQWSLLLLLLSCQSNLHEYPVMTRLVCPLGQFELLCSTDGTQMRWTVNFPDIIDSEVVDPPGDQIIEAGSPEVQSFVIKDSAVLLISRTSSSPLTSLLGINNTIIALNGTRIECTQSMTEMFSTVITIIGNGKV